MAGKCPGFCPLKLKIGQALSKSTYALAIYSLNKQFKINHLYINELNSVNISSHYTSSTYTIITLYKELAFSK